MNWLGFLRRAVGEKLQIVGETIGGLMAQADATQQQAPDKFTQLMEGVNQIPWLSWGIAGFAVFAVAIAAIAKLTGNLDKIISFFSKYFGKSGAEQVEQQAAYLRKQLLQQMKTDVALRLEDSLHNLVRVDLEQEEQRHQVGRKKESLVKAERKKFQPFKNLINRGLAVFRNNQDIEPVAPAEKTYNIFHRLDIGGRLLILGEPGAGKTTELLTVAQRLVDAAVEDSDKPVPLIFELSSWTPNAEILTWLGLQLQQSYGVSQKLAEPLVHEWVQKNRLLLLLDGLDELGQRKQIACIEALEDFLAQYPTLSSIVCCRREEYEQAEKQLKQLNGAVYLQSIESPQIQQYLKDLGQKQLWSDIQ
ncbi:MAG: NACHT domain-containing protein, partial [Cyanobacteria bacterium J06560_2]